MKFTINGINKIAFDEANEQCKISIEKDEGDNNGRFENFITLLKQSGCEIYSADKKSRILTLQGQSAKQFALRALEYKKSHVEHRDELSNENWLALKTIKAQCFQDEFPHRSSSVDVNQSRSSVNSKKNSDEALGEGQDGPLVKARSAGDAERMPSNSRYILPSKAQLIGTLPEKNKTILQSLLASLPKRLANLPELLARSPILAKLGNKLFLSSNLLASFPKTELHCHLEAAFISLDLIYKIAKENNCSEEDLEALEKLRAPGSSIDWRYKVPTVDGFDNFLKEYTNADATLRVNLFLDFAKRNDFTGEQLEKLREVTISDGSAKLPSETSSIDNFKTFVGNYAWADAKVRLNLLLDFAKQLGFAKKQFEKLSNVTEFTHFLKVYDQLSAVLQKSKDIEALTYEYLLAQQRRGVIYQELTVAPILTPNLSFEEYIDAVSKAINRAQKDCGIEARILLVIVRHHPNWSQNIDELLDEKKYGDPKERFPHIVGIGVAGDEKNFPLKRFGEKIKILSDHGYPCTPHAGERTGPKRMKEDLKALTGKYISQVFEKIRVGHGINAIKDLKNLQFLKQLVAKGVHFEICMQSNTAFLSEEEIIVYFERIVTMLNNGANINFNSDDPVFFGHNLGEYILGYLLGSNLYQNTRNGIDASFAPEELKVKLREKVKVWMDDNIKASSSGELRTWYNEVHSSNDTLKFAMDKPADAAEVKFILSPSS